MTEDSSAGRRWALAKFGPDGLALRKLVPTLLNKVHAAHAEMHASLVLSDVVDNPTTSAYGTIWRPLLQTLSEKVPGEIEGAHKFHPRGANYDLLLVNNVLLYPVRCLSGADGVYRLRSVSESREAILRGQFGEDNALFPAPARQQPDDELDAQEREILAAFRSAQNAGKRVVAVAIISTVHGLTSMEWGDAVMQGDGLLAMPDFKEDLTWAFQSVGDTTGTSADSRHAKSVVDQRPGTPDGSGSTKPADFADGVPIDPLLPPRRPLSSDPGPSGTDKNDGEGDQGASSE